jgi:acetyltransferase-like isoleucine patch superfamily enzyme
MMEKWYRYDWPNHLWAIRDGLLDRFSVFFWTLYTRLQMRSRGISQLGEGLRVSGHILIFCRRRDSIRIGKQVALVSRFRTNLVGLTNPLVMETRLGGTIEIGDHSALSGVVLSSRTRIAIGQYVKIGGNVRIYDHDYHSIDWQSRRSGATDSKNAKTSPVVIGDDCFIGVNAIILKGTEIGARSIVAAGSVVVGLKIPADSLVAGNPAKILKRLA